MKLIIDIDDEMVCNDIKNKELEPTSATDEVIINALYNGIPYEERSQGDLISRSELKKAFDDYIKANPNISGIFEVGKFITDNAPTVIPDIEEFDKALHKWFEDIDEWEKKNGKIRPQGEWIDYDNTFYKCPECGYLLEKCCPQCQNKVILPKGGAE